MNDTFNNDILVTESGEIDHNVISIEAERRARHAYGENVDMNDIKMWRDKLLGKAEMLSEKARWKRIDALMIPALERFEQAVVDYERSTGTATAPARRAMIHARATILAIARSAR